MSEKIAIETMSLSELNKAEYNPRIIDEKAFEGLSNSIERFGLVEPIIYNKKSGNIIGGHQRYDVLISKGVIETDVVIVDLDEIDEKALNITLNNPKIQGEFNDDLQGILSELQIDFEGFTEVQLDQLLIDEIIIPDDNQDIDEDELAKTKHQCPECGFEW